MEFTIDAVDFSVPEFFEQYSAFLPKIVIVNQGYCGDILQDTFDKGQILRIHAFSRQKRVIAKRTEDKTISAQYFSIPLDYPVRMCLVDKKGKARKDRPLSDIVKEHILPIDVQFASGDVVTVGSKVVSSHRFPQLTLIDTFEEMYLLGNVIIEGVVQMKSEAIPLYLRDMRLALVTGIKDQSLEKWKKYNAYVTEQVQQSVEFDLEYGNKEMAVYHHDSIRTDSVYMYIAPSQYANITTLLQPTYEQVLLPSKQDSNIYDEVKEQAPPKTSGGNVKSSSKPSRPTDITKDRDPTEELASVLKKRADLLDEMKVPSPEPPPLAPKPQTKPPVLPQRGTKTPGMGQATSAGTTNVKNPYKNEIPRGEVLPSKAGPTDSETTHAQAGVSTKLSPDDNAGNIEIASLSIGEVCEWLTRLKLSQYCDKFEDEMIDGSLLKQLDEVILREEFGMKRLEMIRLINFAKNGHVPK